MDDASGKSDSTHLNRDSIAHKAKNAETMSADRRSTSMRPIFDGGGAETVSTLGLLKSMSVAGKNKQIKFQSATR